MNQDLKEQVKKEEDKGASIKERTKTINLTPKQVSIIQGIVKQKEDLEKLLGIISQKEQDIIDFALGFSNIMRKDVEQLKLNDSQTAFEVVLLETKEKK